MSSLLVPVIGVPPAGATPTGYPQEDYTNYARAGSNVEYPGGLERLQVIGASFDSGFSPYSATNHHFNATHQPGGSATLTVKWGFDKDPGYPCIASEGNPTSIRVEIRHPGGSQIGTSHWSPTLGVACSGSASQTVYFDNDPLDPDNNDGALAEGAYEIYIRAEGDSGGVGPEGANLSGADSRGVAGNGPHLGSEFYSSGWFTVSSGLVFNESFTAPNGTSWNATRWSTNSNGTSKIVDVQNNQGRLAINNASARSTANITNTADSEIGFAFRFANSSKSYLRVYLRWLNDSGYRVELRPDSSTIKLQKIVNGSSSTIDSFTYSETMTDQYLEQFRFRVQGEMLKVKVWKAGTPEPEDWQLDIPETSVSVAGKVEISHDWSSTNGGNYQAVHLDNLDVGDFGGFFYEPLQESTGRWKDYQYRSNIGFHAMSHEADHLGVIWVEHTAGVGCNPVEQDLTTEVWSNIRNSTMGESDMERWSNGVWMQNQSCNGSVTFSPNSDRPSTFNYSNDQMDTGIFWDQNQSNFFQPDDGSYIGGRVIRQQADEAFCTARGVPSPHTTCGGRAFVQMNWKKWIGASTNDYRRRQVLHETGHSHGLVDCPPNYPGGMMVNRLNCGPWENSTTEWNDHDRMWVSGIYPWET